MARGVIPLRILILLLSPPIKAEPVLVLPYPKHIPEESEEILTLT